jgi:hypothetical protein
VLATVVVREQSGARTERERLQNALSLRFQRIVRLLAEIRRARVRNSPKLRIESKRYDPRVPGRA